MWRTLCVGLLLGLTSTARAAEPNTLTLATATPKDKTFSAWLPYAQTVPFHHAVLGKWAGGDTWVLFFSNGTGDDPCRELTQPTGDLLLTLILPGLPDIGKKKRKTVELSEASLYVNAFNALFPLSSLDAKNVAFDPLIAESPSMVRGEIDIRGEHSGIPYEVSGPFLARRCE